MTKLEEAITQAAREMSRNARVELCHLLMHDLDDAEQKEIDDSWAREIKRRIDAIDSGEPLIPGEQVMDELRQKLARNRSS
jgi:putative addiction module component (TIGR02574 family)